MSDHDSRGPQRRNAQRGISFHRHSAKSGKLGLSSSNGDGHPTSTVPSAAIVELWTTHARKQFEMLSEQTKELIALGQKMAEDAEPITRSINQTFKNAS
jgi:hypothetical protein